MRHVLNVRRKYVLKKEEISKRETLFDFLMEIDGIDAGSDTCAPRVPAGHDACALVHVTQKHTSPTVPQWRHVVGTHDEAEVRAGVVYGVGFRRSIWNTRAQYTKYKYAHDVSLNHQRGQ